MYIRKENNSGKILRKVWVLSITGTVFLSICLLSVFAAIRVLAASEETIAVEPEVLGVKSKQPVAPTPLIFTEQKQELIVIDPGHGGVDEGCTNGAVLEKNINLEIAKLAETKLEELGYRVILTREEDGYITKEDRVQMANELGADLYVSIHQNTYEDPEVAGIETWYDSTGLSKESERLAKLVHYETLLATEGRTRELVDSTELYITGETQMPSCLIETGFLSNPEELALLSDPEYQDELAEGIVTGIDLYFHPKTMYLTFDDGPSPEHTEKILDVLKEKNVKATFFMIGEYVERYPEIAKRVAEEGHVIGIHCYRHDYQVLYGSVDSYLEDFEKAYDVIKEVTGTEPVFFRFPGGSVNAYNQEITGEIVEVMSERGFIYYDWNASLEDAVRKAEPEELIAYARETTLGRKKVVMLAHDTVGNTALCLGDLIDQFPEYKMDVLRPGIKPIQFPQPERKKTEEAQ